MMIAAIDQHVADAGGAHFAEGDFLRVVVRGHGRIIKNPPRLASFAGSPKGPQERSRAPRVGLAAARFSPRTSPGAALALRKDGSTFEGYNSSKDKWNPLVDQTTPQKRSYRFPFRP